MEGKEREVMETLKHPEEIRKSRRDPNTYYITDKKKEGELVWKK